MKTLHVLLAGSIAASAALGASAGIVNSKVFSDLSRGIVALKADEGVPHNLVTAMKADDGVPHNLVTAMKADEGVPHNLVTAMKADEGVPHNLVTG